MKPLRQPSIILKLFTPVIGLFFLISPLALHGVQDAEKRVPGNGLSL
ncbi:MAG: hypothetical protein GY940_18965 [bacterium]|nr:hypothetical protein [bacterium]